jgi:hypothetical protein
MNYPERLDNNVTRIVALIVFSTALSTILIPELQFFSILLLIDFSIRYFNPKLSPVAIFSKYVSNQVLQRQPIMRLSSPKRFSVLIGVVFSFFMSLIYILGFLYPVISIYYFPFVIALIIASGLLAFLDICLGCIVYDYLLKIGLFRSQSIDKFLIDN